MIIWKRSLGRLKVTLSVARLVYHIILQLTCVFQISLSPIMYLVSVCGQSLLPLVISGLDFLNSLWSP